MIDTATWTTLGSSMKTYNQISNKIQMIPRKRDENPARNNESKIVVQSIESSGIRCV
jgi:hypothetical protein